MYISIIRELAASAVTRAVDTGKSYPPAPVTVAGSGTGPAYGLPATSASVAGRDWELWSVASFETQEIGDRDLADPRQRIGGEETLVPGHQNIRERQ